MSTVKLSDNVEQKMNRRRESSGRMTKTRKLVMTAMLAAVASVLMFFSIPIPFLIPSFVKLDFSELPALIASFTLGPVSGVTVCLVKNLVNLFNTSTAGVGELCNFLIGAAFVLPAGLIYHKKKTFSGAVIGTIVGCTVMALISVPVNFFLVYPAYIKCFHMSEEGIVALYQAINPRVDNLLQCLVIFNMPFTFFKGLCSVVFTFLIYKPLSPIIKGYH